jgi:hypothetical protein
MIVLEAIRARPARARSPWSAALALSVLSALGAPKLSHADAPRCEETYVSTQQLRNAGKLREAREHALICGQDLCTRTIRTDCARWHQEIEEAMPSVVIEARDASGLELTSVRVSIDGQPLAEKLDGRALQVDPGERVFRFEHNEQLVVQTLLIREAEKYRRVPVVFGAPQPPAPGPSAGPSPVAPAPPRAPVAPAPPPSPVASAPAPPPALPVPPARGWKPMPVATQVLGGVGAAALLTFAALAFSGYSSEQHLREGCGRTQTCNEDDVSSIRTRYLLADIALGVGILAGAGAGAIWIFAAPESPSTAFGLGVRGAL